MRYFFFLKMMHFLSLNIWYVFYDVLRIQYGFKRMLFLFLLPYHFGFLSFFYLSLANASSHSQSSSSYQLYISVTCIYTPSAVCTICFIVHALLSCALYYFWKQSYFRVGVTVVLPALGELNYRHMSVNVFQHYCCCYCPLGEQNWTLEQGLLEKKTLLLCDCKAPWGKFGNCDIGYIITVHWPDWTYKHQTLNCCWFTARVCIQSKVTWEYIQYSTLVQSNNTNL